MNRKDHTSLPFESTDQNETELWNALADLPRGEPAPHVRRRFYNGLHDAEAQSWTHRISRWLGMNSSGGWVTAAACLMLGFGVAQLVEQTETESPRLVALEENLAHLQRELILDRLQDTSVSTRLRGVVEAGQFVSGDPLVAEALLQTASQDSSISVRSAAIDALGSQINAGNVGSEVLQLLENAESPIVQLALVDLVLRNGNTDQLQQLKEMAESGRLHPDLANHVNKAFRSQSI